MYNNQNFNVQACLDYIEKQKDLPIRVMTGTRSFEERSIRFELKIFLIECKDKSDNLKNSDFLKWLDSERTIAVDTVDNTKQLLMRVAINPGDEPTYHEKMTVRESYYYAFKIVLLDMIKKDTVEGFTDDIKLYNIDQIDDEENIDPLDDKNNRAFNKIFNKAISDGLIEAGSLLKGAHQRSLHNIEFNNWLQAKFGDKYNKENYSALCTDANFDNYLKEYFEKKAIEQKIRDKEIIERKKRIGIIAKQTPKGSESYSGSNSFDYSNLSEYFFDNKIEEFNQIENKMIELKLFATVNGKIRWQPSKPKMVAFIYFLFKFSYLKPLPKRDLKAKTKNKYRTFFEKRYSREISKEMQPKRFDIKELDDFKPDFALVIPELKLSE